MRIKTFGLFESRGIGSKTHQSREDIDSMFKDLQLMKDIFQSFEEEWNSVKSDYIILTTDRKVLKYNDEDMKDGLDSLTQLEWRDYYNGRVDTNIWKVKISFPLMGKDRISKLITDSLNYIDRIESEGFYFSCHFQGITSHIGMGRLITTYYDIANKTDGYSEFMERFNGEVKRLDGQFKTCNFYFYFKKS